MPSTAPTSATAVVSPPPLKYRGYCDPRFKAVAELLAWLEPPAAVAAAATVPSTPADDNNNDSAATTKTTAKTTTKTNNRGSVPTNNNNDSAASTKTSLGGAAVTILFKGKIVAEVFVGEAKRGVEWGPQHMAMSYSTGKAVLATLVHILATKGHLEYDKPIAHYWPAFGGGNNKKTNSVDGGSETDKTEDATSANADADASGDNSPTTIGTTSKKNENKARPPPTVAPNMKLKVTLRHLLCHQSGMYDIRSLLSDARQMLYWEEMLALFEGSRGGGGGANDGDGDKNKENNDRTQPRFEPGTAYAYQALSYGWLVGAVVEKAMQKPLAEVFEEHLVAPMGLSGQMYFGVPDQPALDRCARPTMPTAQQKLHEAAKEEEARENVAAVEAAISAYEQQTNTNENAQAGGSSAETPSPATTTTTTSTTLPPPPPPKPLTFGQQVLKFLNIKPNPNAFSDAIAPRGIASFDIYSDEALKAVIPAANGVFSATALATMYAMLARGGVVVKPAAAGEDTSKEGEAAEEQQQFRIISEAIYKELSARQKLTKSGGAGGSPDPSSSPQSPPSSSASASSPLGLLKHAVTAARAVLPALLSDISDAVANPTASTDQVIGFPMEWRLGYHRVMTLGKRAPDAFGHVGYNGSGSWCDPSRDLSFSYVHNYCHNTGSITGNYQLWWLTQKAMQCADEANGGWGLWFS